MAGYACGRFLALLGFILLVFPLDAIITDEVEGEEFMKELDTRYSQECNLEMVARWDYITDVADPDKETAANAAAVRYLNFKGEAAVNCTEYAYDGFTDVELYRRFRFLSKQGPGALDLAEVTEYKDLQAKMETIYGTTTVCDFTNPTQCDLALEPDIEAIMASSQNWDELKYYWEEWRDNTGKLMREDYVRFVELSNKAATLDGFPDTGYYWLNGYTVDQREAEAYTAGQTLDQDQFKDMLDAVWGQVSDGLYKKLHAYVRMRLQEVYPGKIDPTGPIPSHILGNMWAQSWVNIASLVMPFPELPDFDVTDSMQENGWDIMRMFTAAEDFFTSVGLFPMTQVFWDRSVINQTAWGKTIVCHASAEDFCLGPDGDDYRIKMCTEVNMDDLVTVHHEMGHIEYFMAYKNQPHVFRESANPGFHEAIGDLIALSVSTPQHLEDILGLTPGRHAAARNAKYTEDEMRDLNFLMRMALEKIAFLPFGYLIDEYRWGVFDGSIPTTELNSGWWDLRETLQGVSPPEGTRGEEFFDPGAKYHVPANVPYIRYFVSFIVQFQFHARLCEAAGHTGPLHSCDIYGNPEAGAILRTALEKGFSEPWPVVLKELGGSENMDPQPIIDYFQPLIEFLDQALLDAGECIGWGDDCVANRAESTTEGSESSTDGELITTIDPLDEEQALKDMDQMDRELTELVQISVEYDWEYYTHVSQETASDSIEAWSNVSHAFREWYGRTIAFYQYEDFKDEILKRRFRLQKNLDTAALPEDELEQLNTIVNAMTTTYTKAEVTDMTNETLSYPIDELELIMAQLDDEEELKYYWTEWRDVSGKLMKDNYTEYIKLLNKAAVDPYNGFPDAGAMWVDAYTESTLNYTAQHFKDEINSLWTQIEDFYKELHGYVRHKLKEKYGDDVVDSEFIPAHLLGNMWAQSWENIYELVAPFPEVPIPDITESLEDNIDDVRKMFLIAEEFFTSLGLYKMTDDFRNNTVYEQDEEQSVICHASAWDFYDVVKDPSEGRFRIKMCTNKTQEEFIVIHHEMGHTEYQMAYSVPQGQRPLVFRDGANPGFHEAIGDTIALSVSTPSHLRMIENFLNSSAAEDDMNEATYEAEFKDGMTTEEKENINFLMKTALAKIAFLPYSYILDRLRWDLFEQNGNDMDYNRQWWSLRLDVQGIAPPVRRSPDEDFDPGCKYHVPTSVPYIRYFVAHILQFQFHHRLCALAYKDKIDEIQVFNCDIYNSTEAGDALRVMLNKGASQEWHTQLKEFMGDGKGDMNATALLDYFYPLRVHLHAYIEENDIEVGWPTGKVDDYMTDDYIPATVPIVVGCVLAVMVLVVIVAYFVGRSRQKKKEKKLTPSSPDGGESIEIGVQNPVAKSGESSDSE